MIIRVKNWLASQSLMSKVAQWLCAFLLALIIGCTFIMFSFEVAGNYFFSRHPIVVGEKDLGAGLITVAIFSLSILCSIPIISVLTWFFKKSLTKYILKPNPSFERDALKRAP